MHACMLPCSISNDLSSKPCRKHSTTMVKTFLLMPSSVCSICRIKTIWILHFFDISLFFGCGGDASSYPQVPWLAHTGAPNLTFSCEPLLWIVSHREMTIKHSNYIQLCPFMYTKRACVVFSSFRIPLGRFFMRSEV